MTSRDDGESIGLFEPLIVPQESNSHATLNDLALSLAEKSDTDSQAGSCRSLKPAIVVLGDARSMLAVSLTRNYGL